MRRPRISVVLNAAADKHLWDGIGEPPRWFGGVSAESCCAVSKELELRGFGYFPYGREEEPHADPFCAEVAKFLRGLGCPTGSERALPKSWSYEQRQGTRYAWLKLAAQIAREQGK